MKKTQVIVLAAGKGKRMESDGPKALVSLGEKPFLSHVLDMLDELPLEYPPVVVVGHQKEKVIEAIGPRYIYAEQTEQLGTGHAVLSAKKHTHPDHGTVFVSYTDQPFITKETVQKLVSTQQQTGAVICMATTIVPDFEDWRKGFLGFGRIKRDTENHLVGIVEYKDATEEEKEIKEVNPAYFAFDATWLWEKLTQLKNDNVQGEYYITDLVKLAFQEHLKIETVSIDPHEALGANSKAELEILETMLRQKNS